MAHCKSAGVGPREPVGHSVSPSAKTSSTVTHRKASNTRPFLALPEAHCDRTTHSTRHLAAPSADEYHDDALQSRHQLRDTQRTPTAHKIDHAPDAATKKSISRLAEHGSRQLGIQPPSGMASSAARVAASSRMATGSPMATTTAGVASLDLASALKKCRALPTRDDACPAVVRDEEAGPSVVRLLTLALTTASDSRGPIWTVGVRPTKIVYAWAWVFCLRRS
jgi:hypothetical protein